MFCYSIYSILEIEYDSNNKTVSISNSGSANKSICLRDKNINSSDIMRT